MYRAPYREDKTPSMHIDMRMNVWCDYGNVRSDGRHLGGGNIELADKPIYNRLIAKNLRNNGETCR